MQLRQQQMDLPQQAEAVAAAAGVSRQGFIPARRPPKASPGWGEGLVKPPPPDGAIQEQLNRILSSQTLAQSKRLVRFLTFIVEKQLQGEGKQLNEYLIGIEVYQRPSSFDSQIDTIVRTEARRLRSKLKQYYENEGIHDPILIEVPKGSYAPTFRERDRGILDKKPGQLISHYRLLEKLGEGGMGTVYLAEDTWLKRQVALKFIHHSQIKEKHAKERLFREARAAAAIDHPNVATVYEVGEVEGHPLLSWHVEGQNLEERILEGLSEIQEGLQLAGQLADALEAAHNKGVIHRDLNLTNVILGEQGACALLISAWQAKLLQPLDRARHAHRHGQCRRADEGRRRGSPYGHLVAWRILYEALTGKRPFEAEHRDAVYYAITHKAPEPLNRWRAEIPEELSRIVLRCLEKEPANRYSDVAALKADLSRVRPDLWQVQDRSSTTLPLSGEGAEESIVRSGSSVQLESLASTSGQSTAGLLSEDSATGKVDQLAQDTSVGSQLLFQSRTARWTVAATVAILLVLAGSVWWVRTSQRQQSCEELVAAPSIPRLVVLPLSRTPGEENRS
jgi:serine/threonine protein kinase